MTSSNKPASGGTPPPEPGQAQEPDMEAQDAPVGDPRLEPEAGASLEQLNARIQELEARERELQAREAQLSAREQQVVRASGPQTPAGATPPRQSPQRAGVPVEGQEVQGDPRLGIPPYIETADQAAARKAAEQAARERAKMTADNSRFRAEFGELPFEVLVHQLGAGDVVYHQGDLVPATELPDEFDLWHHVNTGTIRLAGEYVNRGLVSTTRPVESQGLPVGHPGLTQTAGPTLAPLHNPGLAGAMAGGVLPGVGGVGALAGSRAEQALIQARSLRRPDAAQPPPANTR